MGSEANYVNSMLAAIESGQLVMGFNLNLINKPRAVGYSHFDNELPQGILILLGAFVWDRFGTPWSITYLVFGVVLYFQFIKPWIIARAESRTIRRIRTRPLLFGELWAAGALSLLHPNTGDVVAGPEDNYREFIYERILKRDTKEAA